MGIKQYSEQFHFKKGMYFQARKGNNFLAKYDNAIKNTTVKL